MMWVNEPNKSTRSRQISKKKTKSSGQRQVQEETMPPSPEPDGLDSLAISLCEQLRTRRTWSMCAYLGARTTDLPQNQHQRQNQTQIGRGWQKMHCCNYL